MAEISVIIPFYNGADSCCALIEHLNSFFCKNKLDAEFVIVDDGSHEEHFRQLERKSSVIKTVSIYRIKKNIGQYAALAYGISIAEGSTIIVSDQDIPLLPEVCLTELIDGSQEYDLQYVYDEHDDAYTSQIRHIASTFLHALIRVLMYDKAIIHNPMPFRVIRKEISDCMKERNYMTSIIDVEMVSCSKQLRFLKIEKLDESRNKNISKYSKLRLTKLIAITILNFIGRGYKLIAGVLLVGVLIVGLITHSMSMTLSLLLTGIVLGAGLYFTNRRYSYKNQVSIVEEYIDTP